MSSTTEQIPLEVGPLIGEMPSTQLMTAGDVLELFREKYQDMPRKKACEELDIPHPLLCDYLGGRRNVHRCKKVMKVMGLEGVEMFRRSGKDQR